MFNLKWIGENFTDPFQIKYVTVYVPVNKSESSVPDSLRFWQTEHVYFCLYTKLFIKLYKFCQHEAQSIEPTKEQYTKDPNYIIGVYAFNIDKNML